MGCKGQPPNPVPPAPKRPSRKRLFLNGLEYVPDVSTAIQILSCLASDCDPVEVKLDNGKWFEFDGLNDFDTGGVIRIATPHNNCPSCDCTLDIDAGGPSNEFMIRYYAMDRGTVEGSLFDMVLDRMGIQKG